MAVHYYQIDDDLREVTRCSEAEWLARDASKWTLARSVLGRATVSTVFLGQDCSHDPGVSEPQLFETMVFWSGHEMDYDFTRYATAEDALAGHEATVKSVSKAIKKGASE